MLLQLLVALCFCLGWASAVVELINAHTLSRYELVGKSSPDMEVEFLIFIKQRNTDKLADELFKVSSIFSESYGKHWTHDEVNAFTENADGAQAVRAFLNANGMRETKAIGAGNYIYASAAVSVWENALQASFNQYRLKVPLESQTPSAAADASKEHTKALQYSIPAELEAHISAVHGVTHFPLRSTIQPHIQAVTPMSITQYEKEKKEEAQRILAEAKPNAATPQPYAAAITDGFVTPAILRSHYGISSTIYNNAHNGHNTSQGVYATIEQNFSPNDLDVSQTYLKLNVLAAEYVGPMAPNKNAPHAPYNQDRVCTNPNATIQANCFEGNLDIQYITAMGSKVKSYFMYDDNSNFLVPWLATIAATGSTATVPRPDVLSISYGVDEYLVSTTDSDAFDTEAKKLGLMGTTIFVSSGDDGAPGSAVFNNGKPDCKINGGYNPGWPASSQYVVAVGATSGIVSPNTTPGKEVACASNTGGRITSGGGFSKLSIRPTWQNKIVGEYLLQHQKSATSGFAVGGRAYPDISLLGAKYFTVVGDYAISLSGTSASAPSLAGMVSLINAERKALGKSTIGLMTVAMYQSANVSYPAWATDIISGDNKCVQQVNESVPVVCCKEGFSATKGWDPVTGFGVPNFYALYKYFSNLGPGGHITYRPTLTPTPAPTHAPNTLPPHQQPTLKPTFMPSRAPTFLRTAAPSRGGVPTKAPFTPMPNVPKQTPSPVPAPNIDLLVTQSVNGVDYNAYLAEKTICDQAIKEAVARTLDGVNATRSTEEISGLVVSALPVRRFTRRALLQTGIKIVYDIVLYEVGMTAAQVQAVLIDAVDNNRFTILLNTAAHQYGASALYTAKTGAGEITVSDVSGGGGGGSNPTPTSETASSKKTSAGVYVGIVLAFLVVVAIAVYYHRQFNAMAKHVEKLESMSGSMSAQVAPPAAGAGVGPGSLQGGAAYNNYAPQAAAASQHSPGKPNTLSSYGTGRESMDGDMESDNTHTYHLSKASITSQTVVNPIMTNQENEERASMASFYAPSVVEPIAPDAATSEAVAAATAPAANGSGSSAIMSLFRPNPTGGLKGKGPVRPSAAVGGSSAAAAPVGGAKQGRKPAPQASGATDPEL